MDVTPDGHGDCVRSVMDVTNESERPTRRQMFVKPHEKRMKIKTFRDLLRRRSPGCEDLSTNNGRHALGAFPLHRHAGRVEIEHCDIERFSDGFGHPPVFYYSKQVRYKNGKSDQYD